jgi:hypothetical protein
MGQGISFSILPVWCTLIATEISPRRLAMKPADDLKRTLFRIHEKGYKAYQDIVGEYLFSQ